VQMATLAAFAPSHRDD